MIIIYHWAEGSAWQCQTHTHTNRCILHTHIHTHTHTHTHTQTDAYHTHRAALSLGDVEVVTVELGTLCLGAEGDATATLAQPAGVHAVHIALRVLLAIIGTLRGDWIIQGKGER